MSQDLQAQLDNVRAILQGCSFDLQLARKQRDFAYQVIRQMANASCIEEARAYLKDSGLFASPDDRL
jgi:hypothetical protein